VSREWRLYVDDMRQACRKILRYTRGLDLEGLRRDEKAYDAVVRNLEVIGEAAKHIPKNLRARMPSIEWRKIAGLRDVLAHAYFGIDDAVLWDVVQTKVPALVEALEQAPPEEC